MKLKPEIIKKHLIFLAVFFSLTPCLFSAVNQADVMNAMRDEISRSMKELSVGNLKKPYYIEARLKIHRVHTIKSVLGTVEESENYQQATLSVGVRVGSYKFDNTNFFDFGLSFFGSSDEEESFKSRTVPISPDYQGLRRELWLAIDAAYKQVTETYSKKEATVKNRVRKDTTDDFLYIKPEKDYDTSAIPAFDYSHFSSVCNEASAVFLNYPGINVSAVDVEYLPETVYFVNSEGREYIKTNFYSGIEMVASTQAKDGMNLAETFHVYGLLPGDLPGKDSVVNAAKGIAKKLSDIKSAPILDDSYSGPILFEGQSAAENICPGFCSEFSHAARTTHGARLAGQ